MLFSFRVVGLFACWGVRLSPLLTPNTFHSLCQFLDEFSGEVKYDFLDHYKISCLPASCPYSNFSKVACLLLAILWILDKVRQWAG